MRIILDDRRPLPENSIYNCVRTYEECTFLLRNFHTITYISLDFDLGQGETGLDVLKYMIAVGNDVKHINIHSSHAGGVEMMQKYVEQNFANTKLTFHSL